MEIKEKNIEYSANQNYTYADLLEMEKKDTEDEYKVKRHEVIDGEVIEMAAPSIKHQDLLGELIFQFKLFLKGKKCRVFSEAGVIPSGQKNYRKVKNYFIPDIMVVCDTDIIDKDNIMGVPSLVIEIVSQGSRMIDKLKKFNIYKNYGVKEYWIIEFGDNTVSPYILNENKEYELPQIYKLFEDDIPVKSLKGFKISLQDFYKEHEDIMSVEDSDDEKYGKTEKGE